MKTKSKDKVNKQKVTFKAQEAILQQFTHVPRTSAKIKPRTSALLEEISANFKTKTPRTWNINTLPYRIEHMVKSGAGVTSRDLERIVG